MNPAGRIAIVTGGGGNLGAAVVAALAARGTRVVVFDRVEAPPDSEASFRLDLTDADAVKAAVAEVWEKVGPVEILVNAVGRIASAPLVNIMAQGDRRHDLGLWRDIIEANLTAPFVVTAAVAERMVATRTKGVIVNFSSVASGGNAGQGAYSAAKAGLNAASIAWAKELGLMGIRVVGLSPGFIDTESTRQALAEPIVKEWVRRTPLRRLGTADEIAGAVLFAVENDHLTGKVLDIDGGLTV